MAGADFVTGRVRHSPAWSQAGLCPSRHAPDSPIQSKHLVGSARWGFVRGRPEHRPSVGQPHFALQAVGWHRARGRGRRPALAQAAGSWLAQRAWAQDDFSFRCWGTQLWQLVGQRMACLQAGLVTGRLGHRPAWPQAGLVTGWLGHKIWSQTCLAQSRRLCAVVPALRTDRWGDAFLACCH